MKYKTYGIDAPNPRAYKMLEQRIPFPDATVPIMTQ